MGTALINEKDNVLVDLETGHKIARRAIAAGESVIKYGFPIGTATQGIAEGEAVHSHNLKTALGDILRYSYRPNTYAKEEKEPFMLNAYERENGDIGIRNNPYIVPYSDIAVFALICVKHKRLFFFLRICVRAV